MKQFLRELYNKNRRDFEVWNYLWLFADNNSINFTLSELSGRFGIPMSSLHRILNMYPEKWNEDKVFVEQTKVAYKQYNITFYPKGKKAPKSDAFTIYNELFDWLKEYYADLDYDYTDMAKHKKYVKTICNKLEKAMRDRNTEVTNDSLSDTFKFFFLNIGDWWKDSGNVSLTVINKNFTKILNQIKNNGTSKKRDSYSKAAAQVDQVDFSKLTQKQEEVS